MYESLTTGQLVNQSLKGRTQSANESVHSKAARTTAVEQNLSFEHASVVEGMRFSKPSDLKQQADHSRDSGRKINTPKHGSLTKKRSCSLVQEEDHD